MKYQAKSISNKSRDNSIRGLPSDVFEISISDVQKILERMYETQRLIWL